MANTAYPEWVKDFGPSDWADATKTYYAICIKAGSYNAAHTTLTGASLTQITAAGYSLKNITGRSSARSGSNVNLTGGNAAFGSLPNNGESITACVVVRQIGGSPDASVDRVALFADSGTAGNTLPFALNGGPFDFIPSATGHFQYQVT